ncbi:ABC transporter permease [Metamycoplasma canadense]|uniref:ABC transporter permease n=1 Tax=Metamycoplasma canadense TaxID=29554 RepID=UPI00064524AE|nr:ABC transporter permease [Metamycoplasma canadense]
MKTTAFKYSQFAFNILLKKKSSIIMPILVLCFSLIIGFVFKFGISNKYLSLASYLYTFAVIIATILFASIKALNIFKDFEQEGIELISLAKPISRNKLVLGKLISLVYFGLLWSGVVFISALISLYGVYLVKDLFIYAILFLIVSLATYLLIGLITALIGYKLNQKIAITIPLVFFIPLALGGSLLSSNATSNMNNAAYFINKKYPYHFSGNEANVEPYFINNQKDELLIIPNGSKNKSFSNQQIAYLQEVMNIANKSSKEWQIYSWLSLPYQLLDIFNKENKNVFQSISKSSFSNLDKYVYYNNFDNISFKYKLDKDIDQKKYPVLNFENNTIEKKYIVPGLLKSNSVISNTIDTDIIYAREDSSNINTSFPEDDSQFSAQNNLVGKLKWEYVYQVLKDKKFNEISKNFVSEFISEIKNNNNLIDINKKLLKKVSFFVNDIESPINKYSNANLILFNEHSIQEKKLQSEIERKIYFAVAILNYIYFNYQDTPVFEALIKNPKKLMNMVIIKLF